MINQRSRAGGARVEGERGMPVIWRGARIGGAAELGAAAMRSNDELLEESALGELSRSRSTSWQQSSGATASCRLRSRSKRGQHRPGWTFPVIVHR